MEETIRLIKEHLESGDYFLSAVVKDIGDISFMHGKIEDVYDGPDQEPGTALLYLTHDSTIMLSDKMRYKIEVSKPGSIDITISTSHLEIMVSILKREKLSRYAIHCLLKRDIEKLLDDYIR